MTFDVVADVHAGTQYDWLHHFEICVICRRCNRPSLLHIKLADSQQKHTFAKTGSVTKAGGDLEPRFKPAGFIDWTAVNARPCPESLPAEIEAAFKEGAACLAVNCPNAAGAMFRLCLDLATKGLLPSPEAEDGPSKQDRRNLAPRLRWLFDHSVLPTDLRDLSQAVKEHGDDGAHDGSLSEHDAEDIYDFAFALLERLFTFPARIEAAKKKRDERRKSA
jgi:hypothetical protein